MTTNCGCGCSGGITRRSGGSGLVLPLLGAECSHGLGNYSLTGCSAWQAGGLSRLTWEGEVHTCAFSSTQLVYVFCLVLSRTCLSVQETEGTQVRSLGREDPLEEGMATYSSILAWRTPWTEEPGGLQSTGLHRIRHV